MSYFVLDAHVLTLHAGRQLGEPMNVVRADDKASSLGQAPSSSPAGGSASTDKCGVGNPTMPPLMMPLLLDYHRVSLMPLNLIHLRRLRTLGLVNILLYDHGEVAPPGHRCITHSKITTLQRQALSTEANVA